MSGLGDDEERRLRKNAATRAWKARNLERVREQVRAWKEANPDRSRQLDRESMRRAAVRKKALLARRASGRAWYANNREQERERARRFRHDHPDRVREYQARFRERHPERAAEQATRSSLKWRDKNAEAVRETGRVTAARRRGADPDAYRRWYQANLEQQRERGRQASRLRSRLKALGLPPRQVQRVYAADKRANAAAADEFFARRRVKAERAAVRAEWMDAATEQAARLDGARRREAARAARRRIVQAGSLPAAAVQLQRELREARAWEQLPQILAVIHARHAARIRQEVRMDSVARQHRGLPAYDLDAETDRRIRADAETVLQARLEQASPQSAGRRASGANGSPPPARDQYPRLMELEPQGDAQPSSPWAGTDDPPTVRAGRGRQI